MTGCFEKEGILQRLHAAIAGKDVAEAKLREPSSQDFNISSSRHEDVSDPDHTIDWQAKSMRELRREGVLLGVDLRGCFDKADIVQKLKVAKKSVPADRIQSQHEGAQAAAMAPAQSSEAQQSHTAPRDARQASPVTSMQPGAEECSNNAVYQQLRTGNPEAHSSQASPKRKQTASGENAPESAADLTQKGAGSKSMEPGQEPTLEATAKAEAEAEAEAGQLDQQSRDRDELQKRQREPEQNEQNEQSEEPHKQQRIQSTWPVKDPGDMNLVGEPCFNADAKNHMHRDAEVQGYSLEVVPMRTLIKECKLLGIDASGLYAKCEVINKLMSVLDQTIVYKTAEASRFRVLPGGEVGCHGDLPQDSEALLPEPAGPPIALSPFKESERPKSPPKTTFCPWSLGDPILEEEPEGQEVARGESEEEVEEIIMDVQEGSALKEPGSPSSSSKHQPPQETTRSGEKEEGLAPREQSSPSSPRCLPQAGRLDSVESAVPRARASISELFRLSISELEARCLAEGVEVGPGDSKGVLISRLKQALSKSATLTASSASSPSQPPFPQTTVSQAEPAQVTQPPPSERASPHAVQAQASCKQEPEMFNIGSDDGSCEEHSDTDFFPDLHQGHVFGDTSKAESDAEEARPSRPPASAREGDSEHPEAPASPSRAKTSENHENMASHTPDEADEGGTQHSSAAEPRTDFSTPSDPEREMTSAFDATPAASQGPEVSARGKETETETADELHSQDQDPDLAFQNRRNDGSMFDFDDLDEAEAEPPVTVPAPQREASNVSTAKPEGPLKEKPEETTGRQAAQAPQVPEDAEIPETPKPGESHPLLRFSTKELLELARSRGVDVRGCVEKSDIVDRLTRSPRLTVQPKSESASRTSGSPQKPPGPEPVRLPKAATKAPPRPKSKATPSRSAPKPGNSPLPDRAKRVDYARPPPQVQAAKAASQLLAHQAAEARLAGEVPDGWSARIQTWFGRYPGFSALLPPEAEMWTDQELDVYFGSNGDIWPRGKRPAWFGRSTDSEEAKPIPKPQGPRTYPDLKVHFQTLDLAETTPPEVIRRHYRRLARDCHPDKHPDNVEEATRRFQQITEAYEAIANRLKL